MKSTGRKRPKKIAIKTATTTWTTAINIKCENYEIGWNRRLVSTFDFHTIEFSIYRLTSHFHLQCFLCNHGPKRFSQQIMPKHKRIFFYLNFFFQILPARQFLLNYLLPLFTSFIVTALHLLWFDFIFLFLFALTHAVGIKRKSELMTSNHGNKALNIVY